MAQRVTTDEPRLLYGPNGAALPAGIGRAVQAMANTGSGEREMGWSGRGGRIGGGGRQEMEGWGTVPSSADGSYLWARDDLVAKTRELLLNEPWAQGAVDRKLDMVIGAGWRPSIRPDALALGIAPEEATALGQQIEAAWRTWANDPLCRCDMEETLNASWMLHVMTMEQEISGDGLGVLRWREDRNWPFRTCLQLVDSDRLSNPQMKPDMVGQLEGGVEKHPATGAPAAYHIRNAHPGDWGRTLARDTFTWQRVPRREPSGRPLVLHLFRKDRPGQTRGISRLVAGLARFKQMARFAQAELSNAVINALFAATITSSFDPAVVQQEMTGSAIAGHHDLRNNFYDIGKPMLDGTRIQHLFPGDELKFLTNQRDAASFEGFFRVFLRSIASGLGIAYEQIAMDWSNVNYSSARAALIEVWRGIEKARSLVALMVAQPLLLAVVEDAIDAGLIIPPPLAPGLYEAPGAWLAGRWIGPARGWVDPVKEPLGAVMAVEAGMGSYEDGAAEQGRDLHNEVIPALRRDRDAFVEAGLIPPSLAVMMQAAMAADATETTNETPSAV